MALNVYLLHIIGVDSDNFFYPKKKEGKQAQRRAAAGPARHKRNGIIQCYGSYYPTQCTKWIFIIPIILV